MRKMSQKKAAERLNAIIDDAANGLVSGDLRIAEVAQVTHSLAVVLLHLVSLVSDDTFKNVELLTDSKTKKLEDNSDNEEV